MLSSLKTHTNHLSNHVVGRSRNHQSKLDKAGDTQVALKSHLNPERPIRATPQALVSNLQESEAIRGNECNRVQDTSIEKGQTLRNNLEGKGTAG